MDVPAVFISHSSQDNELAAKVAAWLDALGFQRTFLDFDPDKGIPIGADWEKKLYTEISRCHAMILVLTPSWQSSMWCFAELILARSLGKAILPLAFGKVEDKGVLHLVQAADIVDWNEDGIVRVERRLREIWDELARGFIFPPNREPFPGILSFEIEDAAIYFGRDEEVRSLIEKLEARRALGGPPFLMIVGSSGVGKSSFLKAGVLPHLQRRDRSWIVPPVFRPGSSPIDALGSALARVDGSPLNARAWSCALRETTAADTLSEWLQTLRTGDKTNCQLVVSIDQFEEVFTLASSAERTAFLLLLGKTLNSAQTLSITVLGTMRADMLSELLEESISSLVETFSLPTISLASVSRLIEGPALVAGMHVEPGLTQRIVADVGETEALPLLALMLSVLHRRCAARKQLTLDAYQLIGDARAQLNPVQNSVRSATDDAIERLRPTQADFDELRNAFIPHLVRLRIDDRKRVKQAAARSDLPPASLRMIDSLVNARLLLARVGPQGDPEIEVAHEALFDAWPALKGWLEEEEGFLADIARIITSLEIWESAPRDAKAQALLTGLLLNRAQRGLTNFPDRFRGKRMAPVRDFILASIRAANTAQLQARRRAARTYGLIAASSAVILIAIIVLLWSMRMYVLEHGTVLAERIWPRGPTLEQERAFRPGHLFRDCSGCPEMIVIRPGEFLMGSPDTESEFTNERPRHLVQIRYKFAVSKYEISFAEWNHCVLLGACPRRGPIDQNHEAGTLPATDISWQDTQKYVEWLSRRAQRRYRLLSESEWEYVARAGSDKQFSFGDDIPEGAAHCRGCGSRDNKGAVPVDWPEFTPNAFGVFQMHGNVSEWVQDCYVRYTSETSSGAALESDRCNLRVTRGGSWLNIPSELRSARRVEQDPYRGQPYIGLRIARELEQ